MTVNEWTNRKENPGQRHSCLEWFDKGFGGNRVRQGCCVRTWNFYGIALSPTRSSLLVARRPFPIPGKLLDELQLQQPVDVDVGNGSVLIIAFDLLEDLRAGRLAKGHDGFQHARQGRG